MASFWWEAEAEVPMAHALKPEPSELKVKIVNDKLLNVLRKVCARLRKGYIVVHALLSNCQGFNIGKK